MSGSQKVLRVFGVVEILMAIFAVAGALMGGSILWGNAAFSLLSGVLLAEAAKDARKVTGAWLILLVDLLLSVLELLFALNGGSAETALGAGIAIVLNLIAFIAANNVKKQTRRERAE